MVEEQDPDASRTGMVDATQFLRFSDALKRGFGRLGTVELGGAAQERWQRRLLGITNVAKHDLDRAEEQYRRFRVDFDREFGPEDESEGPARPELD